MINCYINLTGPSKYRPGFDGWTGFPDYGPDAEFISGSTTNHFACWGLWLYIDVLSIDGPAHRIWGATDERPTELDRKKWFAQQANPKV